VPVSVTEAEEDDKYPHCRSSYKDNGRSRGYRSHLPASAQHLQVDSAQHGQWHGLLGVWNFCLRSSNRPSTTSGSLPAHRRREAKTCPKNVSSEGGRQQGAAGAAAAAAAASPSPFDSAFDESDEQTPIAPSREDWSFSSCCRRACWFGGQ